MQKLTQPLIITMITFQDTLFPGSLNRLNLHCHLATALTSFSVSFEKAACVGSNSLLLIRVNRRPSHVYHPTVINTSVLYPEADWLPWPSTDNHQKPRNPGLKDNKCKVANCWTWKEYSEYCECCSGENASIKKLIRLHAVVLQG